MHSRAYVLLQRDFQELKKNKYEGITAFPISDDKMEWEANIEGLQNTIWHVDQHTGRPCIDFLDNPDKWNTSYTLSSILLTLQVMLSNPVLKNPVNLEAARVLIEDETTYKLIVRRLFHEPLQLKDDTFKSSEDTDKFIRSIKVSFDDYYKTWSEIATSKAAELYRTPLLEDPNFIGKYYKWKKMELKHPKEWNLKYAATKARHARENKKPYKTHYQTKRIHLCPTPNSQVETDIAAKTDETEEWGKSDDDDDGHANESWEEEVEGLVAWTNTLDTNTLED
ncbi:ubiquitin-conjugating enzyme E2 U isoform 2-T2 [Hipposideros larvatus]